MAADKPRIGLTAGIMTMEQAPFPGMERPYVNQDYIDALESSGGIPFLLPPLKEERDIPRLLEAAGGLLLTGGPDINPSFYGQDMREKMGPSLARLDRFQLGIVRYALERRMPILGVCRGHQLLNVAVGGTLFQDVTEQPGKILKHFQGGERSDIAHRVFIEPGSRLESIFSAREIGVNSFHHQSVDRLGEGLTVSARSGDGTVEAIEIDGYPFGVSVQWHPEMMLRGSASMKPLFDTFVAACRSG